MGKIEADGGATVNCILFSVFLLKSGARLDTNVDVKFDTYEFVLLD
jgi:hypothetical protein